MSGKEEIDFRAIADAVARELLGEPNRQLSKPGELRFGSNGSLKVAVAGKAAGTFKDFETDEGGGLLDLITRSIGGDHARALEWLEDRFGSKAAPARGGGRIAALYQYEDEEGASLFEVVRYEPKTFKQRKSLTEWSVKGVRVVPYRLPELQEAMAQERPVFIVEGEKDVERLAALGATATCNAGGAGKWKAEHAAFLKGADVVVVPDNDEAGEDHAEKVGRSLKGIAARIRILRLFGLQRKGDVSDWLDAGNTIERFYSLAEEAPDWRPASRLSLSWMGDEDKAPRRKWLVKGLLGQNELSIIHAPSGGGKSFFALDLAARVASGLDWFEHSVQQCPVLYVAAEGASGLRNRRKAWLQAHEDAGRPPVVTLERGIDLLAQNGNGLDVVQDALAEIKDTVGAPAGLIILDTLSRMMPGGVDNEPKDVKLFLENAERLRSETGAHIMIIHHSGKDTDRGMRGSSLLRDYADTVIEIGGGEGNSSFHATVRKQKDGEDGREYRFNLLQSTVGEDEDGDDITTCVLDPIGASAGTEPAGRLTAPQIIAMRALEDLTAQIGTPSTERDMPGHILVVPLSRWREECYERGIADGTPEANKKAFQRIRQALQVKCKIGMRDTVVWKVSR